MTLTQPRRLEMRDFLPPDRRGYHIRASDLPADAIYVGRPSRWGNPFKVSAYGRGAALALYRAWLTDRLAADPTFLAPLAGKRLVCHCPAGLRCHVDILLELGA